MRGRRAVEWRLVDEVVPPSAWEATRRASAPPTLAARSDRPATRAGIALPPLDARFADDGVRLSAMSASRSTARSAAPRSPCAGPKRCPPTWPASTPQGAAFWPLALARELDDAILHLRLNEPELGLLVFRTEGDPARCWPPTRCWRRIAHDWLVREIRLLSEARVQARRPDLAQPGRADRAG